MGVIPLSDVEKERDLAVTVSTSEVLSWKGGTNQSNDWKGKTNDGMDCQEH